jgi:hypothetical protein
MYRDNDFNLKFSHTLDEIPESWYDKILEEYDLDELEAYINRDDELIGIDIESFVHMYRIDNYGLTDEEMDSGDDD